MNLFDYTKIVLYIVHIDQLEKKVSSLTLFTKQKKKRAVIRQLFSRKIENLVNFKNGKVYINYIIDI